MMQQEAAGRRAKVVAAAQKGRRGKWRQSSAKLKLKEKCTSMGLGLGAFDPLAAFTEATAPDTKGTRI